MRGFVVKKQLRNLLIKIINASDIDIFELVTETKFGLHF